MKHEIFINHTVFFRLEFSPCNLGRDGYRDISLPWVVYRAYILLNVID